MSMKRRELAKKLVVAAGLPQQKELLRANLGIVDDRLAGEVRQLCYQLWTTDPAKTRGAATAMNALVAIRPSPFAHASADWVRGIASITRGRFEQAIGFLQRAGDAFRADGRELDGAQAAVATLLAMAMLGRYDEAIQTGRDALKVFHRAGDLLAAGKIEMNLSNILSRRAQHREALRYCASARRRFVRAREKTWQAMAENGLANTYMEMNKFRQAERHYRTALCTVREMGITLTEAEIEASLGNLATMRGDYPAAVRSLEVSRRLYEQLEMPHLSAVAELEIAGIYSELNLTREAIEILRRVATVFGRYRLRAEEARSRLDLGRVLIRTTGLAEARRSLTKAASLFEREGNLSGRVASLLALTEVELLRGDDHAISKLLSMISKLAARDEAPRSIARIELLKGITAFRRGNTTAAREHFDRAVTIARQQSNVEAVRAGETWLGRAFVRDGQPADAKRHFRAAIRCVERLRGSFGADEFSIGFSATRIDAYGALGCLLVSERRIARAFEVFEQSRSRSLSIRPRAGCHRVDGALAHKAKQARAELNALYRKADTASPEHRARLDSHIRRVERSIADLDRRTHSLLRTGNRGEWQQFSLRRLKSMLGKEATLIEYVAVNGSVDAFILKADRVRFVRLGTSEDEIRCLLEELHFQRQTFRVGVQHLERFSAQLRSRADQVLSALYDKLMRPLRAHFRGENLIIVPAGTIHYVPFAALFDGSRYVAEKFEVRYAPSAYIWLQLSERPQRRRRSPLLVGFADERIPMVLDEISSISRVLPGATVLAGAAATFSAFMNNAPNHDPVHIACHGEFRPDSPMFSNLHLSDGWVTVRDILSKRIRAGLITLSACETGLSRVFPGEEILGLARGFLSAGARSLVATLWAANDVTAAKLMTEFYAGIQRGERPPAALTAAQREMIRQGCNPLLWGPFIYVGP